MSEIKKLLELQNDQVYFRLNSDASGEFNDKKSRKNYKIGRFATQEFGPLYDPDLAIFHGIERDYASEYPGQFRGEALGPSKVRFTVLGRLMKEMGQFVVSYRLDGAWLEVNIEQVDEALQSLVFPTAIECQQLVVPSSRSEGVLLRDPYPGRMFFDAFGTMSMPWFGGLKGDAGWMCVISDGYTDAGVHILGLMSCPGWVKSLGAWKSPRQVRYCHTKGGYVGQAKVYRQIAQQQRKHKSLRQRLTETPQIDALIGGRIVSVHEARTYHRDQEEQYGYPLPKNADEMEGKLLISQTHKQVAKTVKDAISLGWKRGLLNVRGWIPGGYDETHPNVWPPEKALGTIDELKALMMHGPILGALHDNYQDIYERSPDFPAPVGLQPNGVLRFGGMWDGGQAYIMCSKEALPFIKENWQKIKAALNPSAMFVDTTTASPLYECYDPKHPVSRAQDAQYKMEMIRVLKKDKIVFGTEETRDFPAEYIDWYEHRHVHTCGETIPLWSLVYHDASISTRYCDPMASNDPGTKAPNYLSDMLYGYALFFGLRGPETWKRVRDSFARTFFVDEWNRKVGLDEMTSHSFLTDDFMVEKTEFSSGSAIIVNYADKARKVEGKTIKAGGYKIVS